MSSPVIVGVDDSRCGLDAVDLAAYEASLRSAPLRIVHAFGRSPAHPYSGAAPWHTAHQGLAPMVHGVPARAEERAHAAAPGIEVSRSVVAGDAREVLRIESRSAALAVVGGGGRSGPAGLLSESTAVYLAAHGHCPLLAVRGRRERTGPVLLAVDGSPAGAAAVEFAFAEAALRGAPLLALHVWNTWSERAYRHPSDPLSAAVSDVDRLRTAEEELLYTTVAPWERAFPGVVVERRLLRSRIRPALTAASGDAQLVVAGARGRGGVRGRLLGSVSQGLLRHARCPVAVVRGGDGTPVRPAPS